MTAFHVMHVPGADPVRDENVAMQRETFEGLRVHEDPDRNGILWNWLNALTEAEEQGQAWTVIMQDDAVPVRGHETHLVEVLRFTPTPIVSLSHFADWGERLIKKNVPFGVAEHALWGQAVAYHSSVIPGLVQVARRVQKIAEKERVYRNWDDRIPGIYNRLTGKRSAYTARALFTHAPIKSIVGNAGNRIRGPQRTILDPGPWWGTRPRYAEIKTQYNGLMERLVTLVREES